MLSPQIAAEFVGTTPRRIYRWIEERKIHFVESVSGKILVCSESLASVSGHVRKPEDQ
jgi:predicted site-specific integrase-resolvase